ncbi:hypothetical protein AB0N17_33480 [Streptomyces sp. NPDC051133]|uniref:hypothetical protein n=1 Tax=Streptomyces sp. NPDC051133 TaxID=3155521 RepID=UPI003440299C
MADGGDFYSKDRPENPRLAEDRPRGGGPEDRSTRTGPMHIWLWWVLLAVVILVLFFIFI